MMTAGSGLAGLVPYRTMEVAGSSEDQETLARPKAFVTETPVRTGGTKSACRSYDRSTVSMHTLVRGDGHPIQRTKR